MTHYIWMLVLLVALAWMLAAGVYLVCRRAGVCVSCPSRRCPIRCGQGFQP
jgi:hypothetical protein